MLLLIGHSCLQMKQPRRNVPVRLRPMHTRHCPSASVSPRQAERRDHSDPAHPLCLMRSSTETGRTFQTDSEARWTTRIPGKRRMAGLVSLVALCVDEKRLGAGDVAALSWTCAWASPSVNVGALSPPRGVGLCRLRTRSVRQSRGVFRSRLCGRLCQGCVHSSYADASNRDDDATVL